jgi:hypothetical protein
MTWPNFLDALRQQNTKKYLKPFQKTLQAIAQGDKPTEMKLTVALSSHLNS